MTRLRLLAGMAVLAGAVVLAAACGSSDESESTSSDTTTTSGGGRVDPPARVSGRHRWERVPQGCVQRRPGDVEAGVRGHRLQLHAGAADDFRDEVQTGCGTESANTGPFYCPADHGVYLDTRFFVALARTAGVDLGVFAQAYVVADEVAHHVQTLLGILQRVRAKDEQDPAGANARSVRFELQADCLAGIWKHSRYRRGQLSRADLADALRAAAVVGSDFQQKKATGTINPEDWTHGSSAQRQHWLTTGFEQKRPAACDTFGG
jgi:predicted metalloprotease